MLDDSYPSDVVNVLTTQNEIAFLTSLMSLVTRTELAQPKIKGLRKTLGYSMREKGLALPCACV